MKITSTFSIFFLLTQLTFAQNIEKTLVKSFDIQGKQAVLLDLASAQVEIKRWDNPTMRIQMTISVNDLSEATFKSLVTAGRYNLVASSDENGGLTIGSPNLKRVVKLQGKDIKENVSYVIFLPTQMIYKLLNDMASL